MISSTSPRFQASPKASSRSIVIASPYELLEMLPKRSLQYASGLATLVLWFAGAFAPSSGSVGCHETEAFVLPALDAANHLLDRPTKARQACGSAISAVTVRSVAVDDEERVGGVLGQISLVDLSVGQTDGTGHVRFLERLRRPHVEQDEALRVAE